MKKILLPFFAIFIISQGVWANFEEVIQEKFGDKKKQNNISEKNINNEKSLTYNNDYEQNQIQKEKNFFLTFAGGPAQINGETGQAFLFDWDLKLSPNILFGTHLVIGSSDADQDAAFIITLNLKLFPMENFNGLFFNIGALVVDEGKDDTDDEDKENALIYAAFNIGAGLAFRMGDNFALVTGVDLSAGATEYRGMGAILFYVGLMF